MTSKILLIEDEEKIARFIELELTHEGYTVTKAFNGREGLAIAEKGEHDLVILDVMLPELNGLEVLRRLRRTSRNPQVQSDPCDYADCKRCGNGQSVRP